MSEYMENVCIDIYETLPPKKVPLAQKLRALNQEYDEKQAKSRKEAAELIKMRIVQALEAIAKDGRRYLLVNQDWRMRDWEDRSVRNDVLSLLVKEELVITINDDIDWEITWPEETNPEGNSYGE